MITLVEYKNNFVQNKINMKWILEGIKLGESPMSLRLWHIHHGFISWDLSAFLILWYLISFCPGKYEKDMHCWTAIKHYIREVFFFFLKKHGFWKIEETNSKYKRNFRSRRCCSENRSNSHRNNRRKFLLAEDRFKFLNRRAHQHQEK